MRRVKGLICSMKSCGGRNSKGLITVRHKGGGNKKNYRIVDCYRDFENMVGKVIKVEYDPNRNVNLGLINYLNGVLGYIIEFENMKIGYMVKAGKAVGLNFGDVILLKEVLLGMCVHNVELNPGFGGKLLRAAGAYARVLRRRGKMAYLLLKSGELRMIKLGCRVTVGKVGNIMYKLLKFRKAGENRWRGKRPSVRGVAKNPIDHPHGGGQGKTKGGRCSVSPWGMLTKGYITRSVKKVNKLIIKSRRIK